MLSYTWPYFVIRWAAALCANTKRIRMALRNRIMEIPSIEGSHSANGRICDCFPPFFTQSFAQFYVILETINIDNTFFFLAIIMFASVFVQWFVYTRPHELWRAKNRWILFGAIEFDSRKAKMVWGWMQAESVRIKHGREQTEWAHSVIEHVEGYVPLLTIWAYFIDCLQSSFSLNKKITPARKR